MCGRVVLAPIRESFGGARNTFPLDASRCHISAMPSSRVLWNSSSSRYGHDEKDQTDDQEQEEQEFGDSRSRNGNTGEAEKRRKERDY